MSQKKELEWIPKYQNLLEIPKEIQNIIQNMVLNRLKSKKNKPRNSI